MLASAKRFFSIAESLAPEILKKLELYESGKSQLLEKIEELSQAIDRLAAENRSTREWFMSRIELLWESTSKRDEIIGESMKHILEHAQEMSRHIGLRETGEKLEALFKVPLAVTSSSALPVATPKATTPTPTLRATPKSTTPPSGKRPAEEEIPGESKRRRVGEP
jgi:septation ring formation regulator EzrA